MTIPFDTKPRDPEEMKPWRGTEQALRQEITRNVIKSLHKQATELQTGDPHKEPPVIPPLNRNPQKHDVVAWRNDGGIYAQKFETKEAAVQFGQELAWVTYYQWARMRGRDMVEKHQIAIPDGMALDDNLMPYKIEPFTDAKFVGE